MITMVCTRCGTLCQGHDELAAENAFDNHKCKGRDLYRLDMDLLTKLARKKITEKKAWKIHDGRR